MKSRDTDFARIRIVLLDRDGVINRKVADGGYVRNSTELELLPGVANAIATLNRSGFPIVVVTNQRGIALGLYSPSDLGEIHFDLQRRLAESGAHIDAFYHCPHERNTCDCRKPGTELLKQALRDFPGFRVEECVLIGDSLTDVQAGSAFGVKTIFVHNGGASEQEASEAINLADATAPSLPGAVKLLFGVRPQSGK